MASLRKHTRTGAVLASVAILGLGLSGCSPAADKSSSETKGVTITVALFTAPPPKAALAEFTKDTGIKVKWSTIDWDSLQTKIAASSAAKTYFADATDVDWSRVGQLGTLKWFEPLEDYLDTESYKKDMPQLDSFVSDGHVVGIPFDASFLTTTVNTEMFEKAGITTMPTTIAEYTADLEKLKSSGVAEHPLNIPFAAAEGLSTYWYQTTAAFGGTVLDGDGKPQFSDPDSAGYKAAEWMVNGVKSGLVPPGNINVSDTQGQQTLMAKGGVASTFADYSGNVGSLYDIPDTSSVVGKVTYLPTPGVDGVGPNVSNPDGIGIPVTAKYKEAAAKFIEWFTSQKAQYGFAGGEGPDNVFPGYFLPSRLSAIEQLTADGELAGGDVLTSILKDSARPVFPEGAPAWYPEFSRAVNTNLHAAAAGSMSVKDAMKAISDTADKLSSGS
ncbi:carbohydrate ABC transporter substrate-binding protein, CUT1 family [Cryobacterium psychrotolerans]|uniref:Carbohydrate ABC transporter substrate-binding protein, CUT1 family n=1 Tax=Cryobacterium psychrotolerans TaxID=386301 RepID=A0A1G8X394_9MICO|nr:extracellular solute-binding protein [Cryobacterium psychrotolerans]SDJ84924.1 carbohydrate ABC transporter substrate-binding protein, CUT1 family [Cryobacterium psychrotolerans]